jgi:hypothetical protein
VSPFASVDTSHHPQSLPLALPRARSEEWLSWAMNPCPWDEQTRHGSTRLSAGLGWASAGTELYRRSALTGASQTPGFSARPATHQRNQKPFARLLILLHIPPPLPCRGDKCITCRVCRCIDSSLPFLSLSFPKHPTPLLPHTYQ